MEKKTSWNIFKNAHLKIIRGVSFEDILKARYIRTIGHHSRGHQKLMFFEFKDQVWVVPYVENEKERFLKTLYPSRKYTKLYERGEL